MNYVHLNMDLSNSNNPRSDLNNHDQPTIKKKLTKKYILKDRKRLKNIYGLKKMSRLQISYFIFPYLDRKTSK